MSKEIRNCSHFRETMLEFFDSDDLRSKTYNKEKESDGEDSEFITIQGKNLIDFNAVENDKKKKKDYLIFTINIEE